MSCHLEYFLLLKFSLQITTSIIYIKGNGEEIKQQYLLTAIQWNDKLLLKPKKANLIQE